MIFIYIRRGVPITPARDMTMTPTLRYGASLEAIASVKLLKEGGRISAVTASQICDDASPVPPRSAKPVAWSEGTVRGPRALPILIEAAKTPS